ncbi:MAG: glycosyltransferase family 2 protein [Archaeoglobaceae archaeon]|nr:glycosyltransferase family 2 protein [Archaeoglobaceae archaeon]MDW7989522.1 glycosyltransferase family 2 protein [Archaeoglobaceae archaeon]
MRIAVVVPVAPFETEKTLRESIEHVKSLIHDLDCKVIYVIDKDSENDLKAKIAREMGVEVLERNGRRGKRAGAINDAVKYLMDFKPEYVLILDVDSRTDEKTILNCISALQKVEKAYIASSRRFICNTSTLVSETLEAEYRFINFLLRKSSFKQFNGLIGVVRFDFLTEGLREDAIAEDADFATRMHARGYRALLVEGNFFEQAPISWIDFYRQRKRWYFGGLQLWRYRKEMSKADKRVRFSWYLALTVTYFPMIAIPLLPLATIILIYYYKKISKLKVVLGFLIYSILLQFSAISALIKFIRKKEVEWNAMRRN